jgi:hypothetical protein
VFRIFSNSYTALTSKRDPRQDEAYESALLLSSYKRHYANQLGVDVYSSNAVLQKELNRVGWAGAFGSFGLSAALSAVGGAATVVFVRVIASYIPPSVTAEKTGYCFRAEDRYRCQVQASEQYFVVRSRALS